MSEPPTLIDKLWSAHEIVRRDDGASLLWVDRHYVHEGSFHAFSQMKERGRGVAEPGLTFELPTTMCRRTAAIRPSPIPKSRRWYAILRPIRVKAS